MDEIKDYIEIDGIRIAELTDEGKQVLVEGWNERGCTCESKAGLVPVLDGAAFALAVHHENGCALMEMMSDADEDLPRTTAPNSTSTGTQRRY